MGQITLLIWVLTWLLEVISGGFYEVATLNNRIMRWKSLSASWLLEVMIDGGGLYEVATLNKLTKTVLRLNENKIK